MKNMITPNYLILIIGIISISLVGGFIALEIILDTIEYKISHKR